MSYTLYDGSVGPAKDALDSFRAILDKAAAAPNAESLPEARLHPDMLPLTFQVHVATDIAQKMAARLSGTEPVALENNLKTFADMNERITQVQQLVAKAGRDVVNSRVGEIVPLTIRPSEPPIQVSSIGYVNGYAMPNIYFHLTTTYAILRKEGVVLGKMDYIVPFMGRYMPKDK